MDNDIYEKNDPAILTWIKTREQTSFCQRILVFACALDIFEHPEPVSVKLLLKFIVSCWVVAGALFSANAQQYHFRNYGLADGLAQSQVYALLQDSRGQLWMGTRGGGLSCFDGVRFRNYGSREGLTDNYILSLAEDSSGIIWVGTNTGLFSFNGRQFRYHELLAGKQVVVEAILVKDSALLIGTNRGILRKQGNRIRPYGPSLPKLQTNISSLCMDGEGHLWAGNNNGLFRVEPYLHISDQQGLKSNLVRCITLDTKGKIWAGTYGGGLVRMDGNKPVVFSSKLQLKDRIIHCIYADRQGNIWFGTQEAGVGYWSARDSLFRFLNELDGLANNHVRSITGDCWGSLWFGTSGAGVSKYYGQDFFHFDRTAGLPGRNVYAVCETEKGLWIGTSAGGLTWMPELGRFEPVFPEFRSKVKVLYRDWQGRTWIGTDGEGLVLCQDSVLQVFNTDNGLRGNWIRAVQQDFAGNIWVAKAGGGLTRMREEEGRWNFTHFGPEEELAEDRVNALALDNNGWIWYGTANKGIGYIAPDTMARFNQRTGLPSNKIRAMLWDPAGFIWIGTADAGLIRLIPGRRMSTFRRFSTRNGLQSNNIYLLQLDKEGNLWVGTESGVDQLVMNESRNVLELRHFGYAEGFLGIETSQNAAICDTLGNLWFGTINGLTGYFPVNSSRDIQPPRLNWRNISLFFEPLSQTSYAAWLGNWNIPQGQLTLPYDQNHLSFEFMGVHQKNPDRVRYQWKLEGLDANWTPASQQTQITYSNLPPGTYRFKVRACNQDGVWSAPLEADFVITPPFWQRWWFYLLVFLLGALLFWTLFRLRVRQLQRKQEKLRLEKELLQLEQKALQLQMNPHFIFHALHTIQGQIGNKDEANARYFLGKFSKLMRLILESSRESLIPLATEISILENYLALEQLNHEGKFEYKITVDARLEPDFVNIPPMLLQPLVENAIQHGILPMMSKGLIEVSFREQGQWLYCEVLDNGVGPAGAAMQERNGHKSTAMKVLRERLAHLEKDKDAMQLQLEARPEGGTRVVLRIPLEQETA